MVLSFFFMSQGTLWDIRNGCAVVPRNIVIRHTRSRGKFGFVQSCHGCLRRQLVTKRRAQSDREGESVLEQCSYNYNKSSGYIPLSSSYLSPPTSSSIEEQQDKSKEPGVRCVAFQKPARSYTLCCVVFHLYAWR